MHLTVLSVLNNVLPFVLVVMAQRDVTGGIAAVFNATAPLFTLFLSAYLIAEERLTWSRVAGIVIGIAGVAVLIGADPAGARGIAAPVMLLAAAACYGVANVFARLKLGGYPPFVVATGQMISSLVLSTVIALVVERPWEQPMPAGETLAAIAAMGTFGSAFASLCHFTVLKRAGATNGMLVTIVLPLTPILLGAIFFGERLSLREIAGAAIIAFALVVIDGRLFRRPGFKGRPRS
jgi:drug/metabolite transporter (DMT)-like permease